MKDDMHPETEAANDRFGLMGERVLAFARMNLDPAHYSKTFQFDTKNWADWDMKDDMHPAGWFPMTGLTLVGLISLNDPPRPKVDVSVLKCRAAGVKVIMVTGDQPPTAAAIAHKVNIITKPELEYNKILSGENEADLVDDGRGGKRCMTEEEAFEKCNSIVIHGDTLARVHNAEEALDDDEIEKGRKIMDWIRKEEVVFARTTPSQKLLIVNACQQLGHVVAVTGDGVNDSPAIKQADIGIAMGSGSEVARNAADMLLLDDNFASIVNGVEEGRLIFDNLKKSIAYTLSSNIPEISPFLIFILVQVPLPLPTILILCIDLGTDMVPAISLAYEGREANIMSKPPRDARVDRLVTAKLIYFSYLQVGVVQAAAGFYAWVVVLKDFGFTPSMLPGVFWAFEKDSQNCLVPQNSTAMSDLTAKWPASFKCPGVAGDGSPFGGAYGISYKTSMAPGIARNVWSGSGDGVVKAGFGLWSRNPKLPAYDQWSYVGEMTTCFVDPSDNPDFACWNPSEALMYAQTAYFITIIVVQWSDILACKTRTLSLVDQGMRNNVLSFGLFFETAVGALLCYVTPFNVAFSTRPVYFVHWLAPMPFAIFILSYDEIRKYLMRSMSENIKTKSSFPFIDWYKKEEEGEQPNNWVF